MFQMYVVLILLVAMLLDLEQLDERPRTRLTDPALSRVFSLEQQDDALFEHQGAMALDLSRTTDSLGRYEIGRAHV